MNKFAGLLLALGMATIAKGDVVLESNEAALDLIRRHSTPPPIAARTLAMTHVAIFDAVNSIERSHQQFKFYVPDSPQTSREAAALQAAYRVLMHLYPADRRQLEQDLAERLDRLPSQSGRYEGVRLGNIVAEQVIAWRSGDGSDRTVRYTPQNRPGRWRPTPPGYQPALLPQWASVTPLGIESGSQFRPADPPELKSKEYARDLKEVQALGEANSRVRTADETEIAHFWADGPGTSTPPGHWNEIAQTVARQQRLSLIEQARLFALLNAALADAAIVCWDMKFHCDMWRPITAIREADTDGNDETEPDPEWTSLLETPPFPTCTSGHSTFSGAAAEMLALFFGRDEIAFTSASSATPKPRSFTRFSQAAEEAGRSRIYGGIHFEFDNQSGLESGRALSRYIYRRHLQPVGAPLAQSGAARQEAFRPLTPDGDRPSRSSDAGDGGWRPAKSWPVEQQTYRYEQPGQIQPSYALPTYSQSNYGPVTSYSAGAAMLLSPTTTSIVSPAMPLSIYCAPAPTVVPGVVGETITYLPAY